MEASMLTLERTLIKIGIDRKEIQTGIAKIRDYISAGENAAGVTIGNLTIITYKVEPDGRGKDFLIRLNKASKGDSSALLPGTSMIKDTVLSPRDYPEVEIDSDGNVTVYSTENKILARSTLHQLNNPLLYIGIRRDADTRGNL